MISRIDPTELTLSDKLIYVNRVSKVVKGGKRLSFSALVVAGDGNGHVGIGLGKATEVPKSINKAGAIAKKNLIKVPLADTTIPHEIKVKFGAAEVLLKPASRGTGIIAGGSVRAVLVAARARRARASGERARPHAVRRVPRRERARSRSRHRKRRHRCQ